MFISLEELNSNVKEEIEFSNSITFSLENIEKTEIKKLENVRVNGRIYKNSSDEFIIEALLTGNMYLEDSISLEDIIYPFSINIEENIEENIEKNENSIDIIPILWQNIVLEVPLRCTNVDDYSNYSGDGWKLVSEKETKSNNPFLELKDKI